MKRVLRPRPAACSLSGCIVGTIAKTAVDIVTLPVKVASAGVDAATTSQAEADQKRGREMRKAGGTRAASEPMARCRRGQRCRRGRQPHLPEPTICGLRFTQR